ncbi:MAG: peptide chain release factor N(5)-glutamine methyltransferase [Arenicella sp.]|nr:peptide chain release factor N(5)-glutamine methyltransferase [Arenicella sp.]
MLSYTALIDDATKQLYDTTETPRIDSEVLMQHVLQKDIAWLIGYGDTFATADHRKAFYDLVAKRHRGQPIAYLIGRRDFWTLTLTVNENVLIPRADTETLVEEALERLPKDGRIDVLELGTGSGAIALSIAKERPLANVIAVEYHNKALDVAKQNGQVNNITNVEFRLSDWFADIDQSEQFDLIASNPPYVEPNDPHLQQGDLRFEPITALAAPENGFADIRNIIEAAPSHLKDNGWIIIEHGFNQAEEVAELLRKNGFSQISLHKDINQLPRCTCGKKSAVIQKAIKR